MRGLGEDGGDVTTSPTGVPGGRVVVGAFGESVGVSGGTVGGVAVGTVGGEDVTGSGVGLCGEVGALVGDTAGGCVWTSAPILLQSASRPIATSA